MHHFSLFYFSLLHGVRRPDSLLLEPTQLTGTWAHDRQRIRVGSARCYFFRRPLCQKQTTTRSRDQESPNGPHASSARKNTRREV